MGKFCEVCAKGSMSGHNVSHSNRKTNRIWAPNVQRVRVVVDGQAKRLNVCTRSAFPCACDAVTKTPTSQAQSAGFGYLFSM